MQKAVKMIVLGMALGMAIEKCVIKKLVNMTDDPNNCTCNKLESTTTNENESSCCTKKTKLDQLIEEFNKIDLSDVKEKTKQALEKFKNKLQSI